MDRFLKITIITALAVTAVFWGAHFALSRSHQEEKTLKVGFVYDGDESTPYTNNFIKTEKDLEELYGERIEILPRSNVSAEYGGEAINDLIDSGCGIIFTTSFGYGETAKKAAGEHPEVQFCQATCYNADTEPVYKNYHTFMGEIYQGRYIAGIVAGMKLKELIDNGEITEQEAKVGYVAAYPYAEVISGYTAFLLGVRSVVPSAVMTVKYTDTWGSYSLEKICAQELIEEGCVIISQHSDTIGPAVACEEQAAEKTVYHVGYNQSMIDVAPTTSLISTRINWSPYITGAVGAVLAGERIESYVRGNVHGKQDIGAGFEKDWVQMMELNSIIAAKGTKQKLQSAIRSFIKGEQKVFYGDYLGVDPEDPEDTVDLRTEYRENEEHSAPMFHYILKDVVTIE